MRLLVLSCNTGEGHNSAGRAVYEQAVALGHEARMLDIMLLAGRRTTKAVESAYTGVVKRSPRVFNMLYTAGEYVSSKRAHSPVYYANALLADPLAEVLEENAYDIILTSHLFPAETLTYMKHHQLLHIPFVSVETDYTCIPFWEETDCDYYTIPHPELIHEYVSKGIPARRLLPVGIPVCEAFKKRLDKSEARKSLGLAQDGNMLLVMTGSMGYGHVRELVSELLRTTCARITVICGRNAAMINSITASFYKNRRVNVVGFTQKVSLYMDACDILFTKPGGLSSTEAAVKGVPIVHTDPIPGCETRNAEFFSAHGLSLTAPNITAQALCGRRLLENKGLRERMLQAQAKEINANAALDTVKILEEITST